jgi:tetratricopeptide (TPR) repeat protein
MPTDFARMRPRRRWAFQVASVVVPLCFAPPALAQGSEKLAAAEALFDEGIRLMERGKYAEACPKLAKSQDLAPNGGTLQNLAKCYEANGQFASAWAVYKGLFARAREAGKTEIAQKAQDGVARMEPKLSTLNVRLAPGADLPNLEVRRDGEPMPRAQLGSAVPIDPGTHVFTAVAPGRNRWTKSVTIVAGKRDAELVVPVLEEDPSAPKPVVVGSGDKTLRVVGLATAAVGAGLLGTGLVFGSIAKSKEDELSALRRSGGAWDADQQAKYDDGENASTLAKVFVISGGAVLGTGVVLFVLGATKGAPSATTTGWRLDVTPGPRSAAADLSVRF